MSWNDVAEALNKMVDQPRESDLYLTPAAKARADKFLAEMRVLHFPLPRVQGDGGQDVAFEWSNKLRLVITAIEAWASMKSFVPKAGGKPPSSGGGGRNAERNFRGEKRTNDTHSSTTDADARLFRKGLGKEAKLCHMGHLMVENRNNLIVDAKLTEANGTAEHATALDMIEDNAKPGSTVAADKLYDTAGFVIGCRERGCTPHVAQNDANRRSAIDGRTTRHAGYAISMIKRKRIEEPFGWIKTTGGLRKTRHRGRDLVEWFFVLTAVAYNLIRIPKLLPAVA
jgi:hypothetical protein